MASDHMYGLDAARLLRWILRDLRQGSALGIVRELFFTPQADDVFRMRRYGVELETPLGVAAGPHTQLAQNIVAAWLCGARYIELKTVQVLDQISVTKPCIDMADEGYNCEWSQELSLDGSYEEYLKAWVLLHVLHHHLFGPGGPGLIFNMSAGYSLEGILSPTVQRFLDRMRNCAEDVAELKKSLAAVYPAVAGLDIPGCMSDSLTISCMHGCPADEVERIALYFIRERKLNTTLKMNPTLLGAHCVRNVLNKNLGYGVQVPDEAFAHDLPYETALGILRNCRAAAGEAGVAFGVKLTNTLETLNSGRALPGSEKTLYMSGRALHPIAIALAERLQKDFNGDLDISFCAGVDALNVADTLACGLTPVTVCSDLLKPGGYGRLAQYLEKIGGAMRQCAADSLEDFVCKGAALADYKAAMLRNLADYAAKVTAPDSRYAKSACKHSDLKTVRPLPALDCAAAPCMSMCPTGQHIPAYLERAGAGDMDGALAVILDSNPFARVLGAMCNQACREKCLRNQYDEALRIRDVKGCAAVLGSKRPVPAKDCGRRAVVIGADPSGLACAYYLALAGCGVDLYDSAAVAGGPVLGPMSQKDNKNAQLVKADLAAILAAGVGLHLGADIGPEAVARLGGKADALYAAQGGSALGDEAAPLIQRNLLAGGKSQPSLVAAVGEGRRAARAILTAFGLLPPEGGLERGPVDIAKLRRKQAFREMCAAKKLDAGSVKAEAGRCLQCDRYCGICVSVCPNRANLLLSSPATSWPVQEALLENGRARIRTLATGGLRQERQVVNIGDFCNECGNCTAFCPSSGAPYQGKVRLHLSRRSFEADTRGILRQGPGLFRGKSQAGDWTLIDSAEGWAYEDDGMSVLLDKESLAALAVSLKKDLASASLLPAVEAALFCRLAVGAAPFSDCASSSAGGLS